MASTRDIKRRIKSIKSTQQVTKAMKMVSAAKLRRVQGSLLALRPYANKLQSLLDHLSGGGLSHPFLSEREIKRVCFIVIAGERGLCGGFNGNVLRFAEQQLAACQSPKSLIVLGNKSYEHFRRGKWDILDTHTSLSDNPSFFQSKELARHLISLYLEGKFDQINIIYNEFRSVMTQRPAIKQILPIIQQEQTDEPSPFGDYIFEPDQKSLLEAVLPQYVEIATHRSLLESKASEHGARMTAMSSATDNALEMIDSLTLSLNRARQAAITKEITEIVGGAAAL
ncbi:MAG: ATP synthase F1 subunit gamma [Clostridiales bacterium]|jgi:F-type H+-transporting ATPase subunit gamma|nr:ATP synthase F1 subunit gamma [Clostridiales bacterium]